MTDGASLLFVYGTLRPGFDGPMALWLRGVARHVGPAQARGRLYRIDDYPGFVPGDGEAVLGDLFALPEQEEAEVLAALDEHEQCSARWPTPHEYRRERILVNTAGGPVRAWTYIYAHDVAGLTPIAGGDFLA